MEEKLKLPHGDARPVRARLVALLLLLSPLAGCAEAPQPAPRVEPEPPAVDDPIDARMRAFLRDEYPRADAVEWDAYRIVRVENSTVGDVEVLLVVALVTREGKEAYAWFDARDLRYLGDRPPTYAEVTGSKMDHELAVALRNASGEPLNVTVSYARPPGMLVADDVLEPTLVDLALAAALDPELHRLASLARNRSLTGDERAAYHDLATAAMMRRNREVLPPYMEARASELRNLTGVGNVTVAHELSQELHAWATPEAIRAIAARPEVLHVGMARAAHGGGWDEWGANWS